MLIQKPFIVRLLTRYFRATNQDQEEVLVAKMRGFPASENEPYLNKYRMKPCTPLIKMIIDSTKGYSSKEHKAKIENFHRMGISLSTNGVFIPGYTKIDRSYWMFPVIVPNRELFRDFM